MHASPPANAGAPHPPGVVRIPPGLRMDLLQSFVVVSEERHMTRAAARLFVTQSGLSRRLAALERAMGTRLVDRTTRSVELTPAGAAFLPYAAQSVRCAEVGTRALADAAASSAKNGRVPAPAARPR